MGDKQGGCFDKGVHVKFLWHSSLSWTLPASARTRCDEGRSVSTFFSAIKKRKGHTPTPTPTAIGWRLRAAWMVGAEYLAIQLRNVHGGGGLNL